MSFSSATDLLFVDVLYNTSAGQGQEGGLLEELINEKLNELLIILDQKLI